MKFWLINPKGRIGIDGIIMLKWCNINTLNVIELAHIKVQWQAHKIIVTS
jgi:hypothetical protein